MSAAPRIKLAYCIDSFDIGGTELNAVRMAENFDRAEFDLHVFHLQADGPLRKRYVQCGFPMTHCPIRGFGAPQTWIGAWRSARRIAAEGCDVVHCHDLYSNIYFGPAARVFSGAQVITSRRWWHATPRAGLPALNRMAYRFSHRVLANSNAVAGMLVADEHVAPARVITVPNFLDDGYFEPIPDEVRLQWRERLGVPPQAFIVGVVARLAAVKRLDTLIAALARLPPDVHGVFIGDGPERAQLESQASGCGVSERTHFAGQVVNAGINLHGLFDVSALCSYSEGFPNSLLEAFGAARAVVATPVGGVRDIVADEVTGLLFAVGDSDALAQAIKRLHEDHALRARLGTAGRAIAEQRYRRKAVIERLQSFYRALARRDRPTGRQAE